MIYRRGEDGEEEGGKGMKKEGSMTMDRIYFSSSTLLTLLLIQYIIRHPHIRMMDSHIF
jgi:hypothetical protein